MEQIIASNVDNFFVISSAAEPPFNNKVIDRLIVAGESSGVNVIIILNKIDLDTNHSLEKWFNLYRQIGYPIIKTSIITNIGLNELKSMCTGKINILWGQSGVGKSSILNSIYHKLDLETGEVSGSTDKGLHTTVTSILLKVEKNTYVIDTPGIREIDPFGIKKEDLSHYFKEFSEYARDCKFNTCTHFHEPDCKVAEAVNNNLISFERYDSYLRILNTIEDDIIF